MAVLSSQQRTTLEKAVLKARKLAETGAYNTLQSFAVDQAEPFAHQSPEQRTLRNRLRNKARLLGDELPLSGKQEINNLAYELAYEYWHKMLFAKFLEANGLLMHPSIVAVTLEECEELAADEGFSDKWVAAANYASRMLPAIFRIDDPLMQLDFAPNDRIALETLIDGIEENIFTADDSLGWVYQFWQSEAKKTINESQEKIDGKKLPAVTQLFTEPYMVHFLIDNTIGAWWVSRNPGKTPPVKFEYLRMMKPETEVAERSRSAEVPAAGIFEGWPNKTAEITSLDPCMGSGHFVAALFLAFAKLRMFEENLNPEEATDKVITENLHGLEIDPRCTQIAAFNLALTAWKFIGKYKVLPEMNLACSGIAPKGKKEDWVKLTAKIQPEDKKERMENGMKMLYDHFQLAPELGSLIDPSTIKPDAFTASFNELQPVLLKALEGEADKDQLERGVMAAGIAKAGHILSRKYTLHITNVPYLSRGKQEVVIAKYCENNYPDAKGDLASVFFLKMLKSNIKGGTSCCVILQNWLFLTTYKNFREALLDKAEWNIIARLGTKGFQTTMWDFNVMLIALSNRTVNSSHLISGIDVSDGSNFSVKDSLLKTASIIHVNQVYQKNNPDARIIFGSESQGVLLNKYAKALQGIATGDFNRFGRLFWEIKKIDNENWILQQSTFSNTSDFVGKQNIIFWEKGEGELCKSDGARIQGLESLVTKGIAVSQMAVLKSTINLQSIFDNNCSVIIPQNEKYLLPIWAFCSSDSFNIEVRKIDQKTSVTNATLVKVPFDLEYWQKVAAEKYPNGLPKPYNEDPTQWLFHGHPIKAEQSLQVAVARLLGYQWPSELDDEMELSDEARELIKQVKELELPVDEDGIVCIPPANSEYAAAERLRELLQIAWGSQWSNQVIEQLLTQSGSRKTNLEEWLRDEFFEQHCKVFQNRPFIWNIWDGRKDGFSALVNYHMLDKENLKKLIYTYLGDWIRQCETKKKNNESGADGLLIAAEKLKEKLLLILEGEPPYDIFIRWKPLEKQPIGWDPDLNDGVRLNIRPFMEAGILRKKPNIKWGVDRGKNPLGSPWGSERDNDIHKSLNEKMKAKEK